MEKKIVLIVAILSLLGLGSSGMVYAQGKAAPGEPAAGNQTQSQAPSEEQLPQWLYGEVSSTDTVARSLVIKYIDFDSDIEKQATVYVGKDTGFENVKSFEDIKPQDIVNVDYVADAQGRFTAVSISVEKLEEGSDTNFDTAAPQGAAEMQEKIGPAPGETEPQAAQPDIQEKPGIKEAIPPQ